jgi:hypothetical protein
VLWAGGVRRRTSFTFSVWPGTNLFERAIKWLIKEESRQTVAVYTLTLYKTNIKVSDTKTYSQCSIDHGRQGEARLGVQVVEVLGRSEESIYIRIQILHGESRDRWPCVAAVPSLTTRIVNVHDCPHIMLEVDALCTGHRSCLPFHFLWLVISSLPFLVTQLVIIGSCFLVYNYS